ncbi:MAG TPA: SRPBCC domain-containing protein [Myxococcales bacterium]|jgi:uncharacterized protein YndB with AHSA1/START domain|nr:SRPBCC domain-containing protein [Myxococcales bacterium]
MPANTADREISTVRIFDAPRALVFEAWTNPKHLVNWWGPTGFKTTMQEMDVKPGGKWIFVMHGPDGTDYRNESVFVEVEKPARLVYEHKTGPAFRATVDFEEQGEKTKLTMRMVFATKAERDTTAEKFGAVEGQKQTIERLANYLPSMDQVLTLTRTYDAPRSLVFSAWSSAKQLAAWWGPNGFTAPECEVEFRNGGKLAIRMTGHGMDVWMRGTFDEIVDQERIVFTVDAGDDAGHLVYTLVTFEDAGAGKTRLTVQQTIPRNTMMAKGQKQGWTEQLEKLAGRLAA